MNDGVRTRLRQGVAELMARFETEPVHVFHVRDLAVVMFDCLVGEHGLGPGDRSLLDAACCLHDIGWAVTQPDGKSHHKESARLIREHLWSGVPREAIELVALVARYHRKAIPSEADHKDFAVLRDEDRVRVRWLAGILRIADGLDRRHVQAVETVEAYRSGDRVWIRVGGVDGLEPEILGARKKADLLEGVSGCNVEIG